MELIIIHSTALSLNDEAKLRDFNKKDSPITIVTINWNGDSKKYKLTESEINTIIDYVDKKYYVIF